MSSEALKAAIVIFLALFTIALVVIMTTMVEVRPCKKRCLEDWKQEFDYCVERCN